MWYPTVAGLLNYLCGSFRDLTLQKVVFSFLVWWSNCFAHGSLDVVLTSTPYREVVFLLFLLLFCCALHECIDHWWMVMWFFLCLPLAFQYQTHVDMWFLAPVG